MRVLTDFSFAVGYGTSLRVPTLLMKGPRILKCNNPISISRFDIMVNVNGNGVFDQEVNALDDNDMEVTAGIMISEFLSVINSILFTMITLLLIITRKAKRLTSIGM